MRQVLLSLCLLLVFAPNSFAQKWQTFDSNLVKQCTGPVFTISTGKEKVPKIGQVMGVPSNPSCGSTVPVYGYVAEWDSEKEGEPTGGFSVRRVSEGDRDIVKCRNLRLSIPKDAVICEIRYYKSNSKGKGFEEVRGLRNRATARDHDWARKGTTRSRIVGDQREFEVEYKNWRRSYDRYFGFEIDFQRGTS